ncbi:prepilin-type N-terminal cleavage/methylation domain-containing protein [Candidatus Parcubacteria bacterium]|nr:prepilin-type N-terminal cleavage/methylation domain-containing protein [Candidatus Parcubacteria bacterium]
MSKRGFTIIELIIVITIVAVLAIGIFVAVDPAKRIGEARDAQRWSDLIAIAKAVELYTADNGQLPSDFSVSNIAEGEKLVLCSSAASRTCDGQTEACLVVDDSDFLGVYLNSIPIDPSKSVDTDTGYYITRGSGNSITFGVCDAYNSAGIEMKAQVSMATLVAVCGDGDIEGSEACDDSNEVTETQTCGNGTQENGTYCNATCTAEVVLTEACDDGDVQNETCGDGEIQTIFGDYCNSTCTATIVFPAPEYCDYDTFTNDCNDAIYGWLTEADVGTGNFCREGICNSKILLCL